MLLVLDVGNTNTVVGIYEGEVLRHSWRLMSERRTADELTIFLLNLMQMAGVAPSRIRGAIAAGVVPLLEAPWQEGIRNALNIECLKVGPSLDLGMEIRYRAPAEVGADRIVNAVAGVAKFGFPLIIADFGTALTLDVVDGDGAYLGGTIAPGLSVSMEALFGKTAKLPKVALEAPPSVIGRTTMESIQSGILFGYAGLVDSLARRIWAELGVRTPLVATGGQASAVAPFAETIGTVEPWLTLEGLRLLFLRNCPDRSAHVLA
ncbi:type III pantothenate kinase [Aminiphilus sp.]|jgi:type III pantothenate kinase|uniref:type III pantothenate kinase n=1 Tax=Aminiphilus sp. TaxID=1872488 RepID=UPI0026018192|nr:type III pantothenate kinase [Aminiphilus sp.]